MLSRNIMVVLLGFAVLLAGILLTTCFPDSGLCRRLTYNPSRARDAAEDDLDTLAIALGRYHTSNRVYPTTAQGLDALRNKPASPPLPPNWSPKLGALPVDPWNRPYVYEFIGRDEPGGQLDLYSLGPDGTVSDDDIHAGIDL